MTKKKTFQIFGYSLLLSFVSGIGIIAFLIQVNTHPAVEPIQKIESNISRPLVHQKLEAETALFPVPASSSRTNQIVTAADMSTELTSQKTPR